MILWLVLYVFSSFAQTNDLTIQEYCFIHEAKMNQVIDQLKFILVPSDSIQKNQACSTIKSSPHRRELIQNYMKKLDPTVQISFSSVEIRRDPCKLKVEKIKTHTKESLDASVSSDLSAPKIELAATEVTGNRSDVMKIQTLKEFELTVNQDVIKGECRALSPTRYEIKLEVRRDALPLTPPLPPGTIIQVPESSINRVQQTSKLQTTLQLSVGEKMEVGAVVKNLQNKAKEIEIPSGAELETVKNQETEKVFLSLD
jgi:hypothetical protein